jgi:hypothetical protein
MYYYVVADLDRASADVMEAIEFFCTTFEKTKASLITFLSVVKYKFKLNRDMTRMLGEQYWEDRFD